MQLLWFSFTLLQSLLVNPYSQFMNTYVVVSFNSRSMIASLVIASPIAR